LDSNKDIFITFQGQILDNITEDKNIIINYISWKIKVILDNNKL